MRAPDLVRALVDVRVGEAQDGVARGGQDLVAARVLAAVGRATVTRTVDLDSDAAIRPVEVDLEAVQGGVDERLGKPEPQERVLRAAARPRAARTVKRDRLLEDREVVATDGARDRVADGGLDEAASERGFVDDVGELVRSQHVGEVDEHPVDGRDRDAAIGRELARIEPAHRVHLDAFKPVPGGRDDRDGRRDEARHAAELRGREVAERGFGAAREHGGQPFPLARQGGLPDGIDAAVAAVQHATVDALGDRARREAARRPVVAAVITPYWRAANAAILASREGGDATGFTRRKVGDRTPPAWIAAVHGTTPVCDDSVPIRR